MKEYKEIRLSGTTFYCKRSFQVRALAKYNIIPNQVYIGEDGRKVYEYILTEKLVRVINKAAVGEVRYILEE